MNSRENEDTWKVLDCLLYIQDNFCMLCHKATCMHKFPCFYSLKQVAHNFLDVANAISKLYDAITSTFSINLRIKMMHLLQA